MEINSIDIYFQYSWVCLLCEPESIIQMTLNETGGDSLMSSEAVWIIPIISETNKLCYSHSLLIFASLVSRVDGNSLRQVICKHIK